MPPSRHGATAWTAVRGPWWVRLALLAVAAVVAYLVVHGVTASSGGDRDAPYSVVYTVTGSVPAADITWYEDPGTSRSSSDFVNGQHLPWTRRVTVSGPAPTITLTAMASTSGSAGSLTCSISVDGQVRSTQTLTGGDPSVACDDSEAGS